MEYLKYYLTLKWETDRAFIFTDDVEDYVLPKSQVRIRKINNRDYDVWVPDWLAIEKGLE